MHRVDTPRRTEGGFAALEVIFMASLIVLVFGLCLNFFSAIYASQAAGRAAWDAARAHSLGQNASAAADAALPGSVELIDVRTFGDGVEITVRAQEPLPWFDLPEIQRRAYVP